MAVYEYRIHPSVGVARMGDSEHAYFIGREAPSDRFEPDLKTIPGKSAAKLPGHASFPFRDKDKKLAKQGARFRVFCYEYQIPFSNMSLMPQDKGLPDRVWEVTAADYTIEWTVEVANLKSRDGATMRPNRPDPRTFKTSVATDLNATTVKTFTGKGTPPDRLDLGAAFLELEGHLVVLGSGGQSRGIPSLATAHSPGLRWKNWEDTAADGHVRAFITPKATSSYPDKNETPQQATGATVIIGVPAYGMDTVPSVNLYHLALNHALTSWSQTHGSLFSKAFHTDPVTYHGNIEPILKTYVSNRYVSDQARAAHSISSYKSLKSPPVPGRAALYYALLRAPWDTKNLEPEDIWASPQHGPRERTPGPGTFNPYENVSDPLMPKLLYLALPELIHKWFGTWSKAATPAGNQGLFDRSASDAREKAWFLDMAHMMHISAGSFYPGIEAGRDVHNYNKWTADWGALGAHVDVRWTGGVGEITQNLAVPWQSDFVACTGEYWPASRPIEVTQDGATYYDWMAETGGAAISQLDFVGKWAKLGFIRYELGTDDFRETSRDLTHP